MGDFIVSARKYRPMTFDTVVGQGNIVLTLKNAIKSNKLAQAFLFCGPRGVGKTTCARILAKTINCQNLTDNLEACGECESCKSFAESASFNIHELDAASNNSVDDIRALVDQVRIAPQDGKYKVYIIDEVHMLSSQAFNAFLKTLEEPPAYAKFILATTEKHKIIPTILSRCQIFDFKSITINDISKHLDFVAKSENVIVEKEAMHTIAEKADGALRDALSIFDQLVITTGANITYDATIKSLNILDYSYYFKLTDFIIKSQISETLVLLDEIFENGFDTQHFLRGFGEHLRNLLVCQDPRTLPLLEVGEFAKERYKKQAEECNIAFLHKALQIHNECDINHKLSNNKRLQLELSVMNMCGLSQTSQLNSSPEKKNLIINVADLNFKAKTVETKSQEIPKPQKKNDDIAKETVVKKDIPKQQNIRPVSRPTSSQTKKFSLKSTELDENKDENASREPTKIRKNTVKAEDIKQPWINFVSKIKDEKKSLYSALVIREPKLEGDTIRIGLVNEVLIDNLDEIKDELLQFMRDSLENDELKLDIYLDESLEEKGSKYLNQKELLQYYIEEKPELLTFINKLNLELDY